MLSLSPMIEATKHHPLVMVVREVSHVERGRKNPLDKATRDHMVFKLLLREH
jgi:hypothetical protein